MLYDDFDAKKRMDGEDVFTSRVSDELAGNLNPKFELREYQKEALGRFDFYFNQYNSRKFPAQLLFHMATGSGKTLIMAANILQLYTLGHRNFIFFVNSTNIIEKTKDNFLNALSGKYLFAPKIKFGDKEVFVKEVDNFEGVNPDNINIVFTTIQGLHTRLNFPKENTLTYEDFDDKEVVLISDEAHHLQTLTRNKLNQTEKEEKSSWEYTIIKGILERSPKNILLEFTATLDKSDPDILAKYEDKIIYEYDLKRFRLDKYSKEIEVLQADLEPLDRALQAVILSQYRRKIAEKHKLPLKPVLLFKSKTIKESGANYEEFLEKVKKLTLRDIQNIAARTKGTVFEKVFGYFEKEKIKFENLIREIQEDFDKEKCILLDSENVDEEKQLRLNSLENRNNEIRAIFAVNMLNEGWDVLNLFDIVRLYDTRDGSWSHGKYRPGKTTLGEAQLIGRGARYYPFSLEAGQDGYKRKYDEDAENELRIVETLFYHSSHNPDYITEIKATLTELGILPEKYKTLELFVKPDFKKTGFWKEGVVFINDRVKNLRGDILSLSDAKIEESFHYELKTGEIKEEVILANANGKKNGKNGAQKFTCKLTDFGENVVRSALDKYEFYRFRNLKLYFPHLTSLSEFLSSPAYLGGVDVQISGPALGADGLTQDQKLSITLFVAGKIADQSKSNTSEFVGTTLFKARLLRDIFGKNQGKKMLKLDGDSERAVGMTKVDLLRKDWFAQNEIYGTAEEKSFIEFVDVIVEKLRARYSDIALLRNERFFQVFNFEDGQAFEPDFLMILKRRNHVVSIYQIFIEPKGDQFKDRLGRFEESKEGWKQKFLKDLEGKAKTDLVFEGKQFRLVGLPFYNKKLEKDFEDALEEKILA